MMNRPDNHEAKMARADLFKLAQYSFKLFKMIDEHQELEGWVQAKITKAADYIASVYHYMEYEMKITEYGDAIENADMYSESIRRAFEQKLTEAKEMAKKAKAEVKKKEKELEEGMAPMDMDGSTAPPPKGPDGQYPIVTAGPNKGKRWSPQTPGPTNPALGATKTKRHPVMPSRTYEVPVKEATKSKKDYDGDGKVESPKDEVWGSRAKAAAKSGKPFKEDMKVGDTKKTATGELTKTKTGVVHKRTDYKDDEQGEAPSTVKQKSASEKKADKANDIKLPKHSGNTWGMKGGEKFGKKMEAAAKCNHTPKGEKCPVHGLKECGGMYEESHQEKTTMKHVKNPTAGEKKAAKDIKPGIKGYSDRAAMLKSAEADGRLKESNKLKQQAAIAIAKKKAK